MRIAQVITSLGHGGAERVVTELCRAAVARGDAVLAVSLLPLPPPGADTLVGELRAAGVTVTALGVTKMTPWRVWRLRRALAAWRPDVVHAHLFHAALAARLAAAPGQRPWKLVETVHIADRRRGLAWRFWLDRRTLWRCDALVAVSAAARAFQAARLGVSPERLRVIPNGIRMPVRPDAGLIARWRAAWGVADCARVLGAVGRLDPQKGFDRLLALLPDLARQVPAGERWGLVILGEGAERPRLEALAQQAAADRLVVCLPGYRPDAAACIGAFDLFVMPSRYEGYGLTLAEAMAHGVPILASTADSLPELLAGYAGGRCLAGDAWTGASLAEAARLAHGEPRWSHTADEMCAAYAALYASKKPKQRSNIEC